MDVLNPDSRPAVRKVPGAVPAVGRMTHEAKVSGSDLKNKSVAELKDILARQEKILANVKLCTDLPDKGKRLSQRKKILEELIEGKNQGLAEASNLLSSLSLSGKKITPEEMEWKFGAGIAIHLQKSEVLDSDDSSDEETTLDDDHKDPLCLLVEGDLPRKIRGNPTASDPLNDSKADVKVDSTAQLDRRSVALSDRIDQSSTKPKFAPFSSLKHEVLPEGVKVPLQKREKSKVKPEELVPLPDNVKAKAIPLSLQESLQIQMDQAEKMKQLHLRQAAERLQKKAGDSPREMADLNLSFEEKMSYRSAEVANDDDEDYVLDSEGEHAEKEEEE